MMLAAPPAMPLGVSFSMTFETQFRDSRRRDTEDVSDIAGRWVARYVRRHWPGLDVEGWSSHWQPGRTYPSWWFGTVEVYVRAAA